MVRIDADIDVQRFGYVGDEAGRRLVFPHAQTRRIEGRSGTTVYGAAECVFDGLEGRLDTLRWKAETASLGGAFLHDDNGRFDIGVERAELPHGGRIVRAEHGVELLAPHITFSELRLTVQGPFGRKRPVDQPPPPSPTGPRRQGKLRFLDSLSGRIHLTVKVRLELPVIGGRSLDQQLNVPIQEGSLDYRALDDSLDWLEGTFLDIKHSDQRLRVQWKVPIFGAGRDLISWYLDDEASTLASFGRVPVRALADFRIGSGEPASDDKRRGVLRAFALDAIDVALSLLAPRHVEAGGGLILFGGDDQPGMVDLKVTGRIHDRGPGALRGAIGSVDTTIKDLHLGSAVLTADRIHFDGIDELEVTFDGFTPTAVAVLVHRVTATNVAIKLGAQPAAPPVSAA
jgi:hypothetical protein